MKCFKTKIMVAELAGGINERRKIKTKKQKVTISPEERKPVKMLSSCRYDGGNKNVMGRRTFQAFQEITLFL